MVRCLYNFVPEGVGEVQINVGEIAEVVGEQEGWWHGKLPDGRDGFFPKGYCEEQL